MPPSDFHLPARASAPAPVFSANEVASMRAYAASRIAAHAPTRLRRMAGLGQVLGLGDLWLKDETARFGLPAFKGLGVDFVVARLRDEGTLTPDATLVCASEGNHGRAVAVAARAFGYRARVYVGSRVAEVRVAAITREGAEVVRVAGTYDDAVRAATAAAARNGWTMISDTSLAGGDDLIPRRMMLGYMRMMDECAAEWGNAPPDLVVVQGGVGGLAGAVASWYADRGPFGRPKMLLVEPLAAAGLLASSRAGRPVAVPGGLETVMGGLCCAEPSHAAWPAVQQGYDGFIAVSDDWARPAIRLLALPASGDPAIACGPSGAAGVAGLLALRDDPTLAPVRGALRIGPTTRALAIITEGVTDPGLYARLVAE